MTNGLIVISFLHQINFVAVKPESLSVESVPAKSVIDAHGTPAVQDAPDDLDFLDSLLGDVGDDLLSTATAVRSSQINVLLPSDSDLPVNNNKIISTTSMETLQLENVTNISGVERDIRDNVDVPTDQEVYDASKVSEICAHLNLMNRRSKAVQHECQRLFLSLYFSKRSEIHNAIVYSLKSNGILAYIPDCDLKGAVYINDLNGNIVLYPGLLHDPTKLHDVVPVGAENPSEVKEKVYPNHKCFLWYEENCVSDMNVEKETTSESVQRGNPSALIISDQASDHSIHDLNYYQNNDSCVILKPLQTIAVQISGKDVSLGYTNSLRMTLVGLLDNDRWRGVKPFGSHFSSESTFVDTVVNDSAVKTENESSIRVMKEKSVGINRNELNVAENESIYKIMHWYIPQYLHWNRKYNTELNARITNNNFRRKNSSRSPYMQRVQLPQSGRISYGINDKEWEEGGLSEIFKSILPSKISKFDKTTQRDRLAAASLAAGYQSAKARMDKLGEEWAEEEDLPGNQVDKTRTSQSIAAIADAGGFRKEIAQAEGRQKALMKEKRKRRMYG